MPPSVAGLGKAVEQNDRRPIAGLHVMLPDIVGADRVMLDLSHDDVLGRVNSTAGFVLSGWAGFPQLGSPASTPGLCASRGKTPRNRGRWAYGPSSRRGRIRHPSLPASGSITAHMSRLTVRKTSGSGPPVAQSSNSTVCTNGIPIASASYVMQPILPLAATSAWTERMFATLRCFNSPAIFGCRRLYTPAEPQGWKMLTR